MVDQDTSTLNRVQGAAIDGRLRVLRIRQRQFVSLFTALNKDRAALLDAIQSDEGYSDQEAKLIYGSTLIELRNHYDALDFHTEFEQEYAVANSKNNEDRSVSFDIAYIIPDPFTMLFSTLSALYAALEAGTCVVVELENTLQKTPALLRRIITDALDKEAFGVVSSRAPARFIAQCVVVDQVRTTGLPLAQRVLASTTQRNVAVVDRTGDVTLAAKEIVASCMALKGASRYAVDLVFVNEFVLDEFTAAVSQEMDNITKTTKLSNGMSLTREGKNIAETPDDHVFREEITSGRAQLIFGTLRGGAVQVKDRSSTLMTRKRPCPVIVICRTTSLDDTIDALNTEAERTHPITALYLFSGAREAKYLSQYIKSQVSYIGHIPAQLIVGPLVPLGYATDLRCRYTRTMFETPSPQIVKGLKSHLVSSIFQKSDFIINVAQKPLKPTGQAPSGAWGFFEQGIVLGALVYLLPIVSISAFGISYVAWQGYQRLGKW